MLNEQERLSSEDTVFDPTRSCREEIPDVNVGNVRQYVVGTEQRVPVVDGRHVNYVNLDNAATTPAFMPVLDCSRRFSEWYASVHRGSGFKSLLSTHVYEKCRDIVADFVGADLSRHTLIFAQNATHALNKLAMRMCVGDDHTVITTMMEHHSNMLPWRRLGCGLEYAEIHRADGTLDLADLENKVRANEGSVCLITVTGGSNVTGNMPPIRRIARLAHEHGALCAVDATQLIPHRPFQMGPPGEPESIDFIAFSAHKMYAPFGSGVLVGPKEVFEQGSPDQVGGGTVNAVTMDQVMWALPPEKDEAGTPNVPGAVALASSIKVLQSIGMENLAEHERELTRRALSKLTKMEGLTLYGLTDPDLKRDRLGVISMTADRLGHGELAAVLGFEWGVGVRNGCFCAQPYVRELLGISGEEMQAIVEKLAAGDHATVPGLVRISFGVYNTADDVDYVVEALQSILSKGAGVKYVLDTQYGDYVPESPAFSLDDYAPF